MFSVSRKAKNLCDVRIEKKGEKRNIISTKFEAKLKDNFKLVTLSLTIKSLKDIPKLYSGQWTKVIELSKKQYCKILSLAIKVFEIKATKMFSSFLGFQSDLKIDVI